LIICGIFAVAYALLLFARGPVDPSAVK
jgi:hypothetical protein